jgi:hypothetical protein
MIRDTSKDEPEDPMLMCQDLTRSSKTKVKRLPEEKLTRTTENNRSSTIKGPLKSDAPERNEMLSRFCQAKSIQAGNKSIQGAINCKSFTALSKNFPGNKTNPQLRMSQSQFILEEPSAHSIFREVPIVINGMNWTEDGDKIFVPHHLQDGNFSQELITVQNQTQTADGRPDRSILVNQSSIGKYCYPVKNPGGFLTRNTHKLKELKKITNHNESMQCLHKNIFLHGQAPSPVSPKTKRSGVVQGVNHRTSCDNFGASTQKTEQPIQITQFIVPSRKCRNPDSRSSKES